MSTRTAPSTPAQRRLPRDLERPRDAFRHLGPNWFASVMGTCVTGSSVLAAPARLATVCAAS